MARQGALQGRVLSCWVAVAPCSSSLRHGIGGKRAEGACALPVSFLTTACDSTVTAESVLIQSKQRHMQI